MCPEHWYGGGSFSQRKCGRCGKKFFNYELVKAVGYGLWEKSPYYNMEVCRPCHEQIRQEVRARWEREFGPETDYCNNPY